MTTAFDRAEFPMGVHDFRSSILARYPHWLCCIKCGIVKRADGKNGPCKGPVKVTLRDKLKDRT